MKLSIFGLYLVDHLPPSPAVFGLLEVKVAVVAPVGRKPEDLTPVSKVFLKLA